MSIKENLHSIHQEIETVCKEWGRDPAGVNLMAVSKMQSAQSIHEALDAGQRLFGENRVQEAQEHWQAIRDSGDYEDLQLHLIGPLQTNKVKDAVALFDVIQTIDREKLAVKLANEMAEQNRDLPCFIQVNTGLEDQKAGIAPQAVSEFYDMCKYECGLDIAGLMCIPPLDDPPALHFGLLKQLAEDGGLSQLSMGMSGDYERAIPLGSTIIRVGTGIFGARS
ncbi:MAG TPA: YggS family pyridoxal phosphate-dependent enzyme [Micavibrio sp.]|nr:YggS family pyridoxal phosphate-dependent enzyme [Micavibrio sp.]